MQQTSLYKLYQRRYLSLSLSVTYSPFTRNWRESPESVNFTETEHRTRVTRMQFYVSKFKGQGCGNVEIFLSIYLRCWWINLHRTKIKMILETFSISRDIFRSKMGKCRAYCVSLFVRLSSSCLSF